MFDLDVRPCIIQWIASFLEDHRQFVRYQGKISEAIHEQQCRTTTGYKTRPLAYLIMIKKIMHLSIPYIKYFDDLI